MKTWGCKIGWVEPSKLPPGADWPMRRAVEQAYHDITGEWPEFTFSGWGAELDEDEWEVIMSTGVDPQVVTFE